MKNINKILALMFFALAVVGCQKNIVTYNDGYDDGTKSYGPPKIEKITLVDDEEELLETAFMGQMVAVHGDNLAEVVSIKFNGVEVDLAKVFALNERVVLPIPRELPEEIDDKMVFTTKRGADETEIAIVVPPLVIDGLYNEFENPGARTRIVGDNFDIYKIDGEDVVLKFGDTVVEIEEVTLTECWFTTPEDAGDKTVVSLASPMIENEMGGAVNMSYRDWGNYILQNNSWPDIQAMTDGSNEEDPVPNEGISEFLRIATKLAKDDWKWVFAGGFNIENQDIIDNPQNYYVKMEVLTKKENPIKNSNVAFQHVNNDYGYSWVPAEGGVPFNTQGEWQTVSFKLSDIFKLEVLQVGWTDFGIALQPYETSETFDFSISNARIAK